MRFQVFPAIDLRHGRAVRLEEGRPDAETAYSHDPVATARAFAAAGAEVLHVVDLDAAFGDGENRALIGAIATAVAIPVQVGGGVRSDADVDALFALGVARVIVGSAAVENPPWVGALVEQHGAERIVIGIDARDGEVRTRGWLEGSARSALEVARDMHARGATQAVYTDISRDGMLGGTDLEGTVALARDSGLQLIVSGGVASAEDVRAAAERAGEGLAGIIVGKALYEGRITLAQALEAAC